MSLFENKLTLIHSFLYFEMVTRGQSRRHVAKRVNQFAKAAASVAGTAGIAAGNFAVKNLLKYFSQPATPNRKKLSIEDIIKVTPKPAPSPGMTGQRGGVPYKRRTWKASMSKSRGRFKKGTRKRTFLDRSPKGITICREVGSSPAIGTTAESVFVGHATINPTLLIENFSLAFTKWMSVQNQPFFSDFNNWDEVITQAGNFITTVYHQKYYNGPSSSLFAITITSAVTTYKNFADQFTTAIRTAMVDGSTILSNSDIRLTTLEIIQGTTLYKKFDLQRAKFGWHAKSTMKIQNRTINSSGNDENDDVDNVPIYGKVYEGKGNGFKSRTPTGAEDGVIANDANVPYLYQVNSNTSLFAEPPKPSQLFGVQRSGKAHLDPGEIKTSHLYHKVEFTVNRLWRMLRRVIVPGPVQELSKEMYQGVYRCFCFEKMIKTSADSAVNVMKVAYEIDQKDYCYFVAPKTPTTSTLIKLAYV